MVRTTSPIGRQAGIVVERTAAGEAVDASPHDLRRTFGTRWSKRVMPPVLKLLMRHAAIQTTLTFYFDQSADDAADALWNAASALALGTKTSTTAVTDALEKRRKSLVAEGIEPA